MAALAVFIGGAVAGDITQTTNQINILLAMVAAFIITGAGNTINDYYDLDIDLVNSPDRPLPSGEITPSQAKNISLILFISGVLISVTINLVCLVIAILNSFLLFFYARNLKRKPLYGNAAVGLLVGSTFLFGGAAVEGLTVALILFILAAAATVGREVAKDIEDLEGDKGFAETIATEYGVKTASLIAIATTAIAIFMSPLPYIKEIFGFEYLSAVMIANLVFAAACLELYLNKTIQGASGFQKKSKIGMLLALASFILGAFF